MLFNLLSALPDGEERAEEEVIARDVATVAYAGMYLANFKCEHKGITNALGLGGADTVSTMQAIPSITSHVYIPQTVSSVQSFFMAMAMYPEVQAKAQAELDTVVGGQRLPTFEDREELPYIVATVKEVCHVNRSEWFAVLNWYTCNRLTGGNPLFRLVSGR